MGFTRRNMLAVNGSGGRDDIHPHGARRLGAERALSRSGDPDSRSRLCEISHRAGERGAARDRHALVRGAGLFRRRALPALERYSQQPHHALGRGDGTRQRVPHAVEQRQRQYARPPGPARHLRARQQARDAHRIRRHHHRADGQVRGQAAQFAERHRGQVRRFDLVQRSALRHPGQLRGPRGDARIADQPVPPRSEVRAGDGGGRRRSTARTGLPSRPTRRSSTSSNPA